MSKDPFAEREARKYENPIASREHILACLEELGTPVGFKHLAKSLGMEQSSQRDALKTRLNAMVRQGQLIVDRRNVYAIASRMELPTGKISAHPDGYGFLLQDGEDIFLARRQMQQVFHGDMARVRIRSRDRRGRIEGEIVEVTERNTQQLVGRYCIENNVGLLEPLNNRISHEVLIRDDDIRGHGALDYVPGQIVVAEIVEQPSLHGVVVARIKQVLGDHLTPGIEVEIALRNNDIPVEQPDEVIEMVDQMPSTVSKKDKLNRYDLTELPFVTIDGEDARDFDDAVYCEPRDGGGFRLYVAIADVAEYVTPDSALDQSAFQRGTSVYFPQYVVPMLPEKLSNGLCSLKPKVERLVLVCEMTISAKGRVSGYQFYEGTIFSHARLTYTQVAKVIGESEANPTRDLLGEITPHLDDLYDLYKLLLHVRHKRGAIEFETTEFQFYFNDNGSVANITPRTRNEAHKLIEECMLCANVCAANFIEKHDKPGLFRVHEPPKDEKVENLSEFLARFNIKFEFEDEVTPADYQAVLEQLRGRENGQVLQMALLRSMNQAVYQAANEGHFGLGYKAYTHFTSPIRRYPDLLTHRLIKSVIHSKIDSKFVARCDQIDKRNFYPYSMEQIITFGEQSSFTERRADAAVYEVLEWVKCDYVSDRVGDVVEGVITGVAKFGFFVELSNIFVEGLVHVSALSGDYYHYDQGAQCLIGEKSGKVYGLGDKVEVQVVRVNVDERKIDFELKGHTPLVDRAKAKYEKPSKQGDAKPNKTTSKEKSRRKIRKRKPQSNANAASASGTSSGANKKGAKPTQSSKSKRHNKKSSTAKSSTKKNNRIKKSKPGHSHE